VETASPEAPTEETATAEAPTEESPAGVEPAAEEPAADIDQEVTETDEFTLTDITLTEAAGVGVMSRLRALKSRLIPRRAPSEAPSPSGPARKTSRWRLRPWQWGLVGFGVLVLLFVLFVAVDAGVYFDKVHHGISVAGHDLSRMSRTEADETLSGLVEEAQAKPITLRSDDRTWEVLPDDLGTNIDVASAIDKAMAQTREANAFVDLGRKIALYFTSRDLPLEGTIDDAKMEEFLATLSEALDVAPVNATLSVVDGSIEVVEGKDGKVVDQETLRTSLTGLLFALHDTELPIPMIVASPDLSAVDVEPALAQVNIMVSADLSLTYEGKTLLTLAPTEIVNFIDVAHDSNGTESRAVPILSAERMTEVLDKVEPKVGTPPVDATLAMDLEAEEPYPLILVEGIDGEGLDRERTAEALTQAAMNTADRVAEVVLKPVEPERTANDVRAMGITDLLGEYRTSPYVGSKDRQANVRLATSLCSGVFLAPGEEFNTDERLGPRTSDRGWATAPGIVGPGELKDVLGGGICQVSTTLFNAVLLAGLDIVERHNHSIFINHYPDGRDATVTAGGKNMRFRNDTDHYVFIYGWSTGINTRFWIWGASDGRVVQPIKFSGFAIGGSYTTQTVLNESLPPGSTKEIFGGQRSRSCSIERTILYPDGTSKTESWSSHWSMLPRVVEKGPEPVTTTNAPTTTTTAAP